MPDRRAKLCALFSLALLIAAVMALDGKSARAQSDCVSVIFENPLGFSHPRGGHVGRWAEPSCRTSLRNGAYASAAQFFLISPQAITIRLDSVEADPFLYLLDDQGDVVEFDDDGGSGLNSRIDRLLPAGTYRALATTFTPGETGWFALVIKVVDAGPGGPCAAEDLGAITETIGTSGEWTPHDCEADLRPGAYADKYTFALEEETLLTIDLESYADAYLFLTSADGNEIVRNNDGGDQHDARIRRRLSAGEYQLIATTFARRERGRYWLSIAPSGDDFTCESGEKSSTLRELTADTGSIEGSWADGHDVCTAFPALPVGTYPARRIGTIVNAYRLVLSTAGHVVINLQSEEADTYVFLADAEGNLLASDDDGGGGTNSRIRTWLPAGEYVVEATTYWPGGCCEYSLEVEEITATGPD